MSVGGCKALQDALLTAVDYHVLEFQMTHAEVLGVLSFVTRIVQDESLGQMEAEHDDNHR